MTKAIVLATAVTAVISLATPALAVTCDDVRALSPTQREYWAKRLGITSEQRQQIKAECFCGGISRRGRNNIHQNQRTRRSARQPERAAFLLQRRGRMAQAIAALFT